MKTTKKANRSTLKFKGFVFLMSLCLFVGFADKGQSVGVLDPVVLSCSSGSSGQCFGMVHDEAYNKHCPFRCKWTGQGKHHCYRVVVILSNFCATSVY